MTTTTTMDRRGRLAEHLSALRGLATRAVVSGEPLSIVEDAEATARARDYFALGASFGLTPRELAALLYKGVLVRPRECGCPSCRVRGSA